MRFGQLLSTFRLALCTSVTLALSGGSPLWAATVQQATGAPSAERLEALHVANAFLWAWTTRDGDAGFRLMSNRLRTGGADQSWLRQFIVGLSNPHHQAFEIHRGDRRTRGRYSFPVVLYEIYTGERKGSAYVGALDVVKEKDGWKVDRLPKSSDNP